jgi:hypothetical protein
MEDLKVPIYPEIAGITPGLAKIVSTEYLASDNH